MNVFLTLRSVLNVSAQAVSSSPMRDRIASLLREQRLREQTLRISSAVHLPLFWVGFDRLYAERLSSLLERLQRRERGELGQEEDEDEEALLRGDRAKNYAASIIRGAGGTGVTERSSDCAVGDVACTIHLLMAALVLKTWSFLLLRDGSSRSGRCLFFRL